MVRIVSLLAICLATVGGLAHEINQVPLEKSPTPPAQDFNMTADSAMTFNLGSGTKKPKKQQTTYVPLKPIHGKFGGFVGEITVGTAFKRTASPTAPASNKYTVIFDTQSANTWMFDDSAKARGEEKKQQVKMNDKVPWDTKLSNDKYDCVQSKAKSCTHDGNFEQVYPDGAIYKGGEAVETIKVNGYTFSQKKIGLVKEVTGAGVLGHAVRLYDGSIGLAPYIWNTHNLDGIFKKLNVNYDMSFAFYISKTLGSGEFALGGYNKNLLAKDASFKYTNAITLPTSGKFNGGIPTGGDDEHDGVLWGIKLKLTVNKKKFGVHITALIESTQPYGMIVPTEKGMKTFKSKIGHGAKLSKKINQLTIDCSKRASLAPLVLAVDGGVELSFTGFEYFPYELVSEKGKGQCLSFFKYREKGHKEDSKTPVWGIGQMFMKKYYMHFRSPASSGGEGVTRKIGFAETTGIEVPFTSDRVNGAGGVKK